MQNDYISESKAKAMHQGRRFKVCFGRGGGANIVNICAVGKSAADEFFFHP